MAQFVGSIVLAFIVYCICSYAGLDAHYIEMGKTHLTLSFGLSFASFLWFMGMFNK